MKTTAWYISLFATFIFCAFESKAQNAYVDSFKRLMLAQKADTNKVKLLNRLSMFNVGYNADSSLFYAKQALTLAEKLNYENGIFNAEIWSSISLSTLGNYPLAIDFGFKALKISNSNRPFLPKIKANSVLAYCYFFLGDYKTSLYYDREIVKIARKYAPDSLAFISADISRNFEAMNQPDSALYYAKVSYRGLKAWHYLDANTHIFVTLGNAYLSKGNSDSALYYYKAGISAAIRGYMETDLIDMYYGIARVYNNQNHPDSAIRYTKKILADKLAKAYPIGVLNAANLLSNIYQLQKEPDSSLKYLRKSIALKDSLFNREKIIAVQNINYKELEAQKGIEAAKVELRNQFIFYFSLAGLIGLLVIAGILLRNKRLRELQNMRNRIADDLHDDIGSTLSSITIMSELAKAKSPEASSLLASIEERTSTIQESMSDIVWAVNPKNDRFENVLQRMNEFAAEILDAKNIELEFTSAASLSNLKIPMGQRKNFYLFFKEVINNAAKYSDAKKVTVYIDQKDHRVEMNIQDDGKGFDTANLSAGNGMHTLRRRAAELYADFKIKSLLQEGTSVRLLFKIT
jgi:two-component system sensor histidine kinase UhpB